MLITTNEDNKKRSGIYQIRNTVDNKVYVGSTREFRMRWNAHICDLINGRHSNRKLQNAWNHHGQMNFDFEIIEFVDPLGDDIRSKIYDDRLKGREQHYMDLLNVCKDGYNIQPKAIGTRIYSGTKSERRIREEQKSLEINLRIIAGETNDEISTILGIPIKIIANRRYDLELTEAHAHRQRREDAQKLLLEGLSVMRIFETVNIGTRAIKAVKDEMVINGLLEQVGQRFLPTGSESNIDQKKHASIEEKRKLVTDGILKEMPLEEIGRYAGCGNDTVRAKLKEMIDAGTVVKYNHMSYYAVGSAKHKRRDAIRYNILNGTRSNEILEEFDCSMDELISFKIDMMKEGLLVVQKGQYRIVGVDDDIHERDLKIRRDIIEGVKNKVIIETYSISIGTVLNFKKKLRAEGLLVEDPIASDADIEDLIRNGMTYQQIQDTTDASDKRIIKIKTAIGMNKGGEIFLTKKRSRNKKIADLILQEAKVSDIMKELKTDCYTIYNIKMKLFELGYIRKKHKSCKSPYVFVRQPDDIDALLLMLDDK